MVRREDIARAVADAVLAVPGVAGLSPGSGVEVSTQFSGGKVIGVRLTGDEVEVHIVADRIPLPPIANEAAAATRQVLAAIGDDRPVVVVVDDIVTDALTRRAG
jgi:hypothetical protein